MESMTISMNYLGGLSHTNHVHSWFSLHWTYYIHTRSRSISCTLESKVTTTSKTKPTSKT